MTHDTNAVYTFLKRLLVDFVKPDFPTMKKVIYFSDGSAAQYKNYKNLTNLIFHDRDFDLQVEWHFFATSHGKNACDGVGGTIKRLAARASLQRTLSNQILTPKQLFAFAQSEVKGVTTFFVDTECVTNTSQYLHPRFSNANRFKGTGRSHQFIPSGSSLIMTPVSGGTLSNVHLKERDNLISIEQIMPGSFYGCRYDNNWYFGVATYVSAENGDVNVRFLHPKGPSVQFSWPNREDTCWVPIHDIITKVEPLSCGSTG